MYHSRTGNAIDHHAASASEADPRPIRSVSLVRPEPASRHIVSATTIHTEPRTNGSSALAAVMELPAPQRPPVAARSRILIVEDDPRVAHVIRETLALEGDADWTVEVATDGARALALAYAAPPAVVLLDVRLPDLDGAEVYRRLRAEASTNGAHILFLTAGASFDLHQRGIEDGVLLRKPFDPDTLVSLVRALIED